MGFDQFFLPPTADHLELVKYLILLMYFIHVPFMSLMIGGTFFSIWFKLLELVEKKPLYGKLSAYYEDKLIFPRIAGIILGALPPFVLVFMYGQVFYESEIPAVPFMALTAVLIAAGISLIYFYRVSLRFTQITDRFRLLIGGAGLLILFLAYFIFTALTSLMLDPGRWYLVHGFSDLLFSWNVIARLLNFTAAAVAVSGAMIVFLTFTWKEEETDTSVKLTADERDYLRRSGGIVALIFTLLQPLFIFWNLLTMPDPSLSPRVFFVAAAAVFLTMFIAIYLYRVVVDRQVRFGYHIMTLFLVVFLLILTGEHYAFENAGENHTAVLVAESEEMEHEREAAHAKLMAASIKVDLKLGEKVFKQQCTSCHSFEKQVVGPAYNDVLPKYLDNEEALIDFIRSPKKINPDLPAMPRLGLSESEVRSVAAYLLNRIKK